jgi:hypothetical protein
MIVSVAPERTSQHASRLGGAASRQTWATPEPPPLTERQSEPQYRLGKCEGRKSRAEMNPEVVALVKRLRRRNPKTGERRSLRAVAAELAKLGHVNVHGRPFAAESIKAMVDRAPVRGLERMARQ